MNPQPAAQHIFELIPLFTQAFLFSSGKEHDLKMGPKQVHTLNILEHGPETSSNLAKKMKISKQQMTPVIAKLFTLGFIQKKENPSDRRNILISITSKGRKFHQKMNQLMLTSIEKNLSSLSEEETRELIETIKKLKSIIQKVDDHQLNIKPK